MSAIGFGPDFVWGVATSAFQIEGGWAADGKGPSVWDTLAHRPGGLSDVTGDVTCDHYHRWRDDLDLLAGLGVTSYRFSISWPRVQPTGRGRWNSAGLDFYDRLVDGLLDRGIEPAVTLYHWDHPQALEDDGGWEDPDLSHRFADYADGVAHRLGDRVGRWMTLNEPLSVVTGNVLGFSRPTGPLGVRGVAIAHQLLLAHGRAVLAMRAAGVAGEIGITVNVSGVRPASDHPADVDAAARAEAYEDRLFLDPLLDGRYPLLDGRPIVEADPVDFAVIGAPIDFLGINWYAPALVAYPWHMPIARPRNGAVTDLASLLQGQAQLFGYTRVPWPDARTTAIMGWPVLPERFGDALTWLRTSYPDLPPVYITENGLPAADQPGRDGRVEDAERIDYVTGCLSQVRYAIDDGMDIRGYYVWSLMDNLEWGLGLGPRFGLVHIDFDTLVRTPKASYFWYRDHIRGQRQQGTAVNSAQEA
jgi:beta-glucosidase